MYPEGLLQVELSDLDGPKGLCSNQALDVPIQPAAIT
jgi:hypothetical protein